MSDQAEKAIKGVAAVVCVTLLTWRWICVNRSFNRQLLSLFNEKEVPSISFILPHADDAPLFLTPFLNYLKASSELKRRGLALHMLVLSHRNHFPDGPTQPPLIEGFCKKYEINCHQIKDEEVQPNPNVWDEDIIASQVEYFLTHTGSRVVVTTDAYGITEDIKHRNTFLGIYRVKKRYLKMQVFYLRSYYSFARLVPLISIFRALWSWPTQLRFSPIQVFRNVRLLKQPTGFSFFGWALLNAYSYGNMFHLL